AAPGDEVRITAELEGIAQALFGVQQDSLAVKRLTVPSGLPEDARAAVHFAEAPARLVSRPTAFPIAQAKLRERQVVGRAGMVGIAFDGAFVSAQRLLHAAHIEQRVSAVRGCGAIT